MLPRDFIVMLVLFGLITGIGFLVVVDISSSESGYDVQNMTDAKYQTRYDTLTNSSRSIYEMQNKTTEKEGMNIISVYTTVYKATMSVISLVFGSVGMVYSVIINLGEDIGIDSALVNLVGAGLLVILISIIIFAVLSSVSKGRI